MKPELAAGKRAPVLMTFYLTGDFGPSFWIMLLRLCCIMQPSIIDSWRAFLIEGPNAEPGTAAPKGATAAKLASG